jgi:hypothetical protein
MEAIQQLLDQGRTAVRTASKLFLEKVWTVRPRRLVLLLVITLACLSLFANYRLQGFTHKHKVSEVADELRQCRDLLRHLNILRNVTEGNLADDNYVLNAAKIQSGKVRESSKELDKCMRDYGLLKEAAGVYGSGTRNAIDELQALKNKG